MDGKYIVERIEDGIATLEAPDGRFINVDASSLCECIKEGSVLFFEDGKYTLDELSTQIRRNEILKKHHSVFKKK